MESLTFIPGFSLFAVACWCEQLPVTVTVVFINSTITVHVPSVSVECCTTLALCVCWCAVVGACQFSTTYFVHLLKLYRPVLMCSCSLRVSKISEFKDTADITCVILKAVSNLCTGLNEATHKTLNHFFQVQSLDGICPATFSGDFHSSIFVFVYVLTIQF